MLAVVLQGQITDTRRSGAPLAEAFAHTFWWALLISVIALVPALWLWRATRSAATESDDVDLDAKVPV